MSRIAYVNGRYLIHQAAAVHIEDRGYQFADGIYEVFGIHKGKLIGIRGHLDRLAYSLSELSIKNPMSERAIMHIVREIIRRNRIYNGLVYLQITRGIAPRDHAFPNQTSPILVVTGKSTKVSSDEELRSGISVISIPDIRWERVDIKSISLLPNVLGKQLAKETGAYEAWMIDKGGFVTEGTSTNAWIVTEEGELVTRSATNGILNGITRLAVMEVAKEAGIRVVERPFTLKEAKKAREAFITASTTHVKPVTKIDGSSIGNGHIGTITLQLLDGFLKFIENGTDSKNLHPRCRESKKIRHE